MAKKRTGPPRVVFWPFALFGNPGGEAGVEMLHEALVASLEEAALEPTSRQHALARDAEVELRPFLDEEAFVGWRAEIGREFKASLGRGEFPVFVGGNHLTALPVYQAYADMDARVCIVSFDAHLDAYALAGAQETVHHGNFLLHLARGPRLSIVNVGHRDLILGPERVREFFDRDWPVEAIAARPLEALLGELRDHLAGHDLVHVDIDVDVLDPSVLRAVGTPMPCGLSTQQLLAILAGIWSPKIAGVTLSEFNGALDADGSGRHVVAFLLEWLLLKRTESLAKPRATKRRS